MPTGGAAPERRPQTAERIMLSEHRGGAREERVQRLGAIMKIQTQGRKMLGKIRQRQSLQQEKDSELEALQREIEELRQLKEGMASDVEVERQTAEVERMVQLLEGGQGLSSPGSPQTSASSPSPQRSAGRGGPSGLPPRPSRLSQGSGDLTPSPSAGRRIHSNLGSGPASTASDESTKEQDAMREEHFGLTHDERLTRVGAILKIQQRFRKKIKDLRARKAAEAEATLRGHYATGARERIKRIKTIVKLQRAFRRRHGFVSPAKASPLPRLSRPSR